MSNKNHFCVGAIACDNYICLIRNNIQPLGTVLGKFFADKMHIPSIRLMGHLLGGRYL